jgi:probable rRNA maturation factor
MIKKPNRLNLDVQFGTAKLQEKWEEVITTLKAKKWVKTALQNDATITLRFVGQAEGKKLNSTYRHKDYATNVLTFPYDSSPESSEVIADIVICLPVVEKEAKEQKKEFLQHLTHLIVHGTLHAQGFDHEDEVEAEGMEELEIAILRKLKQGNPYV